MSVSRLLSEMDSREITQWQAYFEVIKEDDDSAKLKAAIKGNRK